MVSLMNTVIHHLEIQSMGQMILAAGKASVSNLFKPSLSKALEKWKQDCGMFYSDLETIKTAKLKETDRTTRFTMSLGEFRRTIGHQAPYSSDVSKACLRLAFAAQWEVCIVIVILVHPQTYYIGRTSG
jgi:hypothetical protein